MQEHYNEVYYYMDMYETYVRFSFLLLLLLTRSLPLSATLPPPLLSVTVCIWDVCL